MKKKINNFSYIYIYIYIYESIKKLFRKIQPDYIVVGSLVTAVMVSGAILSSIRVKADTSAVDNVSIIVPSSCSLSGSVDTAHTASISNGTYTADIGTTTLTAFCNDADGFAIYAIGYTGEEYGVTNLVGASTSLTIATGTATSGDTSNWAMKLTKVTDTSTSYTPANLTIENSFDAYHTVPSDYTKVASYSSTTDKTLGSKLTTTYAAYISPTQAADTYVGKVKYTLVHPSSAVATIPTAIEQAYEAAGKTKVNGYYALSDMSSSICAAVTTTGSSTTTEVIDTRDNEVYKIAKLADGNCWMLDNLRLDPTDSTVAANLSSSNTNATSDAITNFLNGGSTTTGWSSTAVADVDSGFNSYTAPMINNASKDTLVASYGPASTNGQAKVGVYYNYCAATVGTYCYASGSGVDSADTLIDADQDLCPANWRMPTGGSTGEYYALYNKYNTTQDATSSASLQYNLSTPLSDLFYYSSADSQGSWGSFWSSTYYGGGYMYVLNVNSSGVYPNSYGDRDLGYSMRCLVSD